MSKVTEFEVMTPPGRLVMGNPWDHKLQTEYQKPDKPKLDKHGQQVKELFVALAIGKSEPMWPAFWAKIGEVANRVYVNGETTRVAAVNVPAFAWKVEDGDASPDKTGYAGCWILKLKTQFEIQVVNRDNRPIVEHGQAKCGDYADILITIAADSDNTANPSVFLSPNIVRILGFGEAISGGADVSVMGAAPAMPAGASATPVGGTPMAGPGAPPAGGPPIPPAAAPAAPPANTAPPATPATPAAPPAPPATPAAPPATPARVMTAAAQGATYESYIAAGWKDAQLIQHGLMVGPDASLTDEIPF